ncbi:MAG TPA: hypothetical protein VL356_11700 [Acidocella sp.]|jgi:hypothetical protein|nr:hypothetical protein [Acidocella sp.]
MSPLIHLTRFGYHPSFGYSHPGYAHYGYGYSHAVGGGWLTHMVISSVIHAMIYSVIFRLLGHLSLGQAVLLVVVVIAVLYALNRGNARRW